MAESTVSDFNLQRINTKELADNIKATIQFGGNLLAIARRGTGKTTIASDTIADSKYKEIYFNLSIMERPDLGGYPNFFGSKTDKFIHYLMPSIYKDLIEGDQKCVVVLDEVDKAEDGLLAPLLEFTQKRSVNGYKLKNLQAIVMTGNLPAEGGKRPPAPLLDRTEKFLVEINPEHWLDWGATSGEIHPTISAFIADNLDELSGSVDQGESYADKSPRGWHNYSRMLTFGEQNGWSPKMLLHKAAGCVGKNAGIKYAAFFQHYQELLPAVKAIMAGEPAPQFSQFESTKKMVVCMVLCSRYARLLDDIKDKADGKKLIISDKVQKIGANVAGFLTQHVDPEMALISIRGQIGAKRTLDFNLTEDEHWDKILTNLLNKIG